MRVAPAYLAAARSGRNSAWRFLLCVPLALVLGTALGVVLTLALQVSGRLPTDLADQVRRVTNPPVFFLLTLFSFAAVLAGFALAIPLVHRKSPLRLLGAWSWTDAARGFLIWTLVLAAIAALEAVLAPGSIRWGGGRGVFALLALAAPSLLVQTFTEEFIFRGYVAEGLLLALKRPLAAAAASALLFGALHIPNGAPQAVNATVVGFALAIIAMRTGGLGFGAGLHFANNLFGAVAVVSADDVFKGVPGLFRQSLSNLTLVDLALNVGGLLLLALLAARIARDRTR